VLLILTYANILPISKWVGLLVLLLSVIMIYGGEGVQGLVELPAIFTNILSYMRLGAVGLASVGLAVVINEELVMPFFAKGGFFILAGILIMVIGHTINIGLGIIGPFLHSIRLHYVEFFTRFYKGGGKEYSPFGYKV
jgi:V/A-type H+-transporting ATPase subunit I